MHSKNTRCDPEKGPRGGGGGGGGHTNFRVKRDPEFGQLSAGLTNNGVIDQALGHIPCQVDRFPGHRWPKME